MRIGSPYYRLRRERNNLGYFHLSHTNVFGYEENPHLESDLEKKAWTTLAQLENSGEEVFWVITRGHWGKTSGDITVKYRSKKKKA